MAPRTRPKKTFYLSNLRTLRGGKIALGNIFADPFMIDDDVAEALSYLTPEGLKALPLPETQVLPTESEDIREKRSSSWSGELWAKFLEFIGINLGVDYEKTGSVIYRVHEMKTETFKNGLPEYIRKRVAQEEILQDQLREKPVYMITGVQYATKGVELWIEEGQHHGGGVEASSTVSPDGSASAGGNVKVKMDDNAQLARSVVGEVVFAYQLAKITEKGWKIRKITIKTQAKDAFLSDPNAQDGVRASPDIEWDELTAEAIPETIVENDIREYGLGDIEPAEQEGYRRVFAP
ncbi:hypothetical protein MGU_08834 [Metarhizium guizhouense ARSEF 977]|uniref:Uncharacterized protein n=1 Tax=Metarhizium guizhouense (strain ARSEF 977) TaxID=1276136 RepID=A0A0B4GVX6_METGA|nr:hypothetical protein MGU_08834 [Metarhizium guizhouense ARSEF 977]